MKVDSSLGLLGVLLEPTTVVTKAWEHVDAISSIPFGIRGLCLLQVQVQLVCSLHCSACSADWTFMFLIGLIRV